MSQEILTESAIIDQVVTFFQNYRDENNKLPGEYFDNLFYVNAIQGTPIKIPAIVLRPVKSILKNATNLRTVLHAAILKFSQSWHYYHTVMALDKDGRFNWQIV